MKKNYLIVILFFSIFVPLQAQKPFVTVWNTENLWYQCTDCIKISQIGNSVIQVDWENDGVYDETLAGETSYRHTYDQPGVYEVAIKGNIDMVIISEKLIDIKQWGDSKFKKIVFDCDSLKTISATDVPDLSTAESTVNMFSSCPNFNGDLSKWNVYNIKDMSYMFSGCKKFNSDLSRWNIRNTTDMSYMFYKCEEFTSDLKNWDVEFVKSMKAMFSSCKKFNGDLSQWDVREVNDFGEMFSNAENFSGDLSNWKTYSASQTYRMFYNAKKFNSNISNWSTYEIIQSTEMFKGAEKFNSDLSNWNVKQLRYAQSMFEDAISFNSNLGNWQLKSLEKADNLFNNSGVNVYNYQATLRGWMDYEELPKGITLGVGSLQYCDIELRQNFIDSSEWTLVGDILSQNCIDADMDGFVLEDDCDDTNPNVYPLNEEIPFNGLDDDCNLLTLDNDEDRDGYSIDDDCDDTNADINPGVSEIPNNEIDENCDGLVVVIDNDEDGWNSDDDCDDTNSNINPGLEEIPYNETDDDCDESTLDDDLDQDGYNLVDDCDDSDSDIHPDAEDIPNNGIDENCDGEDATTGVYNIASSTLSVYPNPVVGVLFIEVEGQLDYEVKLYSPDGQLLVSESNVTQIPVKNFGNGVYLLEIRDIDTGQRIRDKVMITQ